MTTRAKRDEASQVEGRSTVGNGLDVVNLEPAGSRAALGTAATIPGKHGRTGALPFRCGADEHSGFTRDATGPWLRLQGAPRG